MRWCGPIRAIRCSTQNARGCAAPMKACRRRSPATGRRFSPRMSAGLQAVRVLMPDNTIQTATLKTVDRRPYRDADAVQRLQDREHRAAVGNAGDVGARGAAQYRPGHPARCGDRLLERARQPEPGGGAAHQRDVPARNPDLDEEASRCRRRDADRRGAGGGAPEPRTRRPQRRGGRARRQPGALRTSHRRAAGPAGPAGVDRPPAAAPARGGDRDCPQGASGHSGGDVRYRYGAVRGQDRREQPVAAARRAGRRLAQPQRRYHAGIERHRQRLYPWAGGRADLRWRTGRVAGPASRRNW